MASEPLTTEAVEAMLRDADPEQTSAASYHAVCRYHVRALAAEVARLLEEIANLHRVADHDEAQIEADRAAAKATIATLREERDEARSALAFVRGVQVLPRRRRGERLSGAPMTARLTKDEVIDGIEGGRLALEVAALTRINERQTALVIAAEAKAEEQRHACDMAWERVHKLEDEAKRYREALQEIASGTRGCRNDYSGCDGACVDTAREAMAGAVPKSDTAIATPPSSLSPGTSAHEGKERREAARVAGPQRDAYMDLYRKAADERDAARADLARAVQLLDEASEQGATGDWYLRITNFVIEQEGKAR